VRASFSLLVLLLLAACGTGGTADVRSQAGHPGSITPAWKIPAEAFGTQRLFRVAYSGPEGEGSFRVTLRLASPLRYQIQAVDPVGRALWGVDVDSGQGIWLDHRNKVSCSFQGSFDVSGIPLGPFPLLSLPSLLMGRVPAEPAKGTGQALHGSGLRGREIELEDDAGRSWSAHLDGNGTVEDWTLREGGREGGEPSVWFLRRDNWSYLSDRARGVQVRWREVLRESLEREPEPLIRPDGYREGACRELYAPRGN